MRSDPPARLEELPTPALLLDLDVLEANLARMAARCRELGVRLRPHIKTHKCIEVARLQRAAGADGITVSTLHEARVFGRAGFEDRTWAFPLPASRVREAAELADGSRLALTVDSPEAVEALEGTGRACRVWLEVDCGYGRSGVDPTSERARRTAEAIDRSSSLELAGLLTHAGHAYQGRTAEAIADVAEEERAVTVGLAERLREAGIEVRQVSVGSTPGMAHVRRLDGVTEVRPGNYAFYDYTQVLLGSCRVGDCALTVLATVVSSGPAAAHSVVDAGALALSKDTGPAWSPPAFGRLLADPVAGVLRDDVQVTSVSQEHGILDGPLSLGDRVRILPNHSCLTAACFDACHAVRGQEVVARWRIERGR